MSGVTPKQLGRATAGDRRPGLHLVEDQLHAVLGGQLADPLEIAVERLDDVDVHHRRLHDQPGDLALELREDAGERVGVVERHRAGELGQRPRVAGAVGHRDRVVAIAERLERRVDGDHHRVVVAVIGALDLEDHVAAGDPAREVDGVHRRLGARVREPPLRQPEAVGELLGDDDRAVGRARRSGCRRGGGRRPPRRRPGSRGRCTSPRSRCGSRRTRDRRRPRRASPLPRSR